MITKFQFMGIPTDVCIIARRGKLLYGVALKPNFDIVMVTLINNGNPDAGLEGVVNLLATNQVIHANEILSNGETLQNNIRVSVHCFVSNAFLDAELKGPIARKINELIAQIPQAEIFDI